MEETIETEEGVIGTEGVVKIGTEDRIAIIGTEILDGAAKVQKTTTEIEIGRKEEEVRMDFNQDWQDLQIMKETTEIIVSLEI